MPTPPMDISDHLKPAEILQRYRSCKNILERERWHILHLVTREGYALGAAEAALVIGRTPDGVRRVIRRYNKEGPDGLRDRRKGKSGRKLLLSETQREELFSAIRKEPGDGGLWTAPKVSAWVEERIGRRVSGVTGWQYLRRLGFTLQVPRPRHSETATEAERTVWKKNAAYHAAHSVCPASRSKR